MTKLDELLELIKKDSNYQYYQKLEKEINKNENITNKVNEIKNLQTQMVLSRELGKTKKYEDLEKKYEILLQELEAVPHVLEYLELQKTYNDLIQNIKELIEKEVEMAIKK